MPGRPWLLPSSTPNAASAVGAAQMAARPYPRRQSPGRLGTVASAFRFGTPGMPPGRMRGVKRRVVQFLGQGIRHNADLAGTLTIFPADGGNRDLDTGAAQAINAEQPLALLQPGAKDDSFRHTSISCSVKRMERTGDAPDARQRALSPRRVCTSPTRDRASTSSVSARPSSLPWGEARRRRRLLPAPAPQGPGSGGTLQTHRAAILCRRG